MPETVEHECRQGRRCVGWTKGPDGEVHAAGVERPDTLCRPCEEASFADIRHLADDWVHLDASLGAIQAGDAQGKVSSSRTYPVPIRLDVDALMNEIETELVRWARIVTRGDIEIPDRSYLTVRECALAVTSRLGTLVDLPPREIVTMEPLSDGGDYVQRVVVDGVDAVLRLARLHPRALAVLQVKEIRIWLPDACYMCGKKALSSSVDQSLVTCQACKNVWSKDEFAKLNPLDIGKAEA